ncbi:MAG: AAA family ATPase [Candidatus Binataceae bacterium]
MAANPEREQPAPRDADSWALVVHRVAHDWIEALRRTGPGRMVLASSTLDDITAELERICNNDRDPFTKPPVGLTRMRRDIAFEKIAEALLQEFHIGEPEQQGLALPAVVGNPPGNGDAPAKGAKVTPISEIKRRDVKWTWPGRIARGKLTVFGGDPDRGKSFVSLDLTARVTTGRPWPDGSPADDIGNVILLSAEDDAADTIRPRLEALGADIARVYIIESITDRSGEREFSLATDLARLETAIKEVGNVSLIIIDPVSAYLGGVDSHKNSNVRSLLAPLKTLAERYGVAIVLITHLSKGDADPLNRLAGSIAFGAAARAAWLFSCDPERPERRLMLKLKNNLAPTMPGLAFSIELNEQGDPVVAWESEPVAITAAEHFRELRDVDDKPRREGPIDDACAVLRELLKDGPRPVAEIEREGKARGVSHATIKRARKLLGIESTRGGFGADGGWVLRLPAIGAHMVEPASNSEGEASSHSESEPLWPSPSLPMGSSKGLKGENPKGLTVKRDGENDHGEDY